MPLSPYVLSSEKRPRKTRDDRQHRDSRRWYLEFWTMLFDGNLLWTAVLDRYASMQIRLYQENYRVPLKWNPNHINLSITTSVAVRGPESVDKDFAQKAELLSDLKCITPHHDSRSHSEGTERCNLQRNSRDVNLEVEMWWTYNIRRRQGLQDCFLISRRQLVTTKQ